MKRRQAELRQTDRLNGKAKTGRFRNKNIKFLIFRRQKLFGAEGRISFLLSLHCGNITEVDGLKHELITNI